MMWGWFTSRAATHTKRVNTSAERLYFKTDHGVSFGVLIYIKWLEQPWARVINIKINKSLAKSWKISSLSAFRNENKRKLYGIINLTGQEKMTHSNWKGFKKGKDKYEIKIKRCAGAGLACLLQGYQSGIGGGGGGSLRSLTGIVSWRD